MKLPVSYTDIKKKRRINIIITSSSVSTGFKKNKLTYTREHCYHAALMGEGEEKQFNRALNKLHPRSKSNIGMESRCELPKKNDKEDIYFSHVSLLLSIFVFVLCGSACVL